MATAFLAVLLGPALALAQVAQPGAPPAEPTPSRDSTPGPPSPEIPQQPPPLTPLEPFVMPPSGFFPTPVPAARLRGPVVLTPSLLVTEEYNDNVFQDNRRKRSDFVTGFTPGFSLTLQSPIYQVTLGYSFTAEIYAREHELNDALARQRLTLDALYRVNPRLTLGLAEVFSSDNNSNLANPAGVSTGRTRTTSNSLAPSVAFDIDPLTTLRLSGAWTIQRFDSPTSLDSDTYRIVAAVDRRLTPRLQGTLEYDFAYFDIQGEDNTTTHTPRAGLAYRFSPTLAGGFTAGPSFVVTGGDTSVKPAARAYLRQLFKWGSAGVNYDHSVTTSGGLGGPAESDSIAADVQVTGLVRNLTFGVAPRYTSSKRSESGIDVNSFNLALQAAYRLTPWATVVAAYNFFRQRNAGSTTAVDVDQNRVLVGVQFGYPITFQ